MKIWNNEKVTMELTRLEISDAMIALYELGDTQGKDSKFNKLGDKLSKILDKFDEENFEKWLAEDEAAE